MAEETLKTPADLAREANEAAQKDLTDLRELASMSSLADSIADLDTLLAHLGGDIAELRTQGYVFKSYLEKKTAVLTDQWREAKPAAQSNMQAVSYDLCREVDALDAEFRNIQGWLTTNPAWACEQLETFKRAVDLAASKARNEQSKIRALFENTAQNAGQTKSQAQDARNCLQTVAEASFKLYPNEDPVAAVKAQWLQDGKNGPKGILYVTDARLLFEQREDVAKEKVLFITTKKERVQKLLIDVPIGAAEKTTESESGALLWHKELLDISFAEGQRVRRAQFKLEEDSATWAALLNRVVSGDIDKERVTPKAMPATPAKPAPTKCSTCSANLDTPILKGMQSIKCPYCGTVMPLS
ncbi:MAG: hypothetical protein HY782_15515 [Chloroflexi bacterium]|nr:hypothetical protein [Chloroflexota bacterium]